MADNIVEFRGVENLVYATILTDNNETGGGYITGEVKSLSPTAQISKEISISSNTKYYDNKPAFTISARGADTITISVPVMPLKLVAELTGQNFDEASGALLEGAPIAKYFAVGYVMNLNDGTKRCVWKLKGSFAPMKEESKTIDDGTDSQGQELVFTGITPQHRFANGGNVASVVVDERDELVDVDKFFETVTDPDKLATIALGA